MCLEQGVLEGVGGLFGFAGRAERHRPQPVAMTAHQGREGGGVACDVSGEQLGVRSRVFQSHGGSVFTSVAKSWMPCRTGFGQGLRKRPWPRRLRPDSRRRLGARR